MALTSGSGSGGRNAFTPFRNPSRDVGATRAGREMRLDVAELDTTFKVKADIPGMNKADIKVHVDADKVIVSVEKVSNMIEDTDEQGVRYYRVERSSQYVRRTVRMPASADLDHMKARYEDGLLLLSMPKRQSMPDHHPVGPEQ